ncbi:MAG: 8-amino-7-oxononanoate synthase [Candidatus Binatia bacterium]|nr:8-amino-7-oxononanoate synthase [Candidatus Binatia bacterium]
MRALAEDLADLEARDLLRVRRLVGGVQGPEVELDGRRVLCLASNNYLGLAGDPQVIEASAEALRAGGASAAASPLISGHMDAHDTLERELADWLGCEAALVFGSGYHANIGVIAALAQKGDAVFSDSLNHASLIDGCRLARADVRIFEHRDLNDLEEKIQATPSRRRLIVSDSVFSMDGDTAPLEGLVALAARHDAWLMLDEAHAMGVFGEEGAGLAAARGVGDRVHIRMGTLGKALGSYGAFVAGSRALIELLVNRARSYVFSTGLPPAVIGAARAAVRIARTETDRRERLWRNARRLHEGLGAAGLRLEPLESTIVPVILGEPATALAVAHRAMEEGVWAPAIRPPTVPTGTARLRLTPIATHDDGQIDRVVRVLADAAREEGA